MKIAFLISAHSDPLKLRRLTDSLPTDREIFVHIDLKNNLDDFKAVITNPRVHFLTERYNVM